MKITLMCLLCEDIMPIEAEVDLPMVPSPGFTIKLCHEAGITPARVEDVVLSTYDEERIEVWLSFKYYDREEIVDAMDGARRGVTP
jgi:hypothetical protein